MKEELQRLQDQETKEMEHELELAKQRQRAIDDLDKGVGGKLKVMLSCLCNLCLFSDSLSPDRSVGKASDS